MATPDPRIAHYIAEIEQPGIPYVSYSHETLRQLYGTHGKALVEQLIAAYFADVRTEAECPDCKGSGYSDVPDINERCPTCGGTGQRPCATSS